MRKVEVEKGTSPHAADIRSHLLRVVVADPDEAFGAFSRRVKAGEELGPPRSRGTNRFAGFGFKGFGNGSRIDGRRWKPLRDEAS